MRKTWTILIATIWVMLFGITAYAGEYESSCPEGYKETVTKSGYGKTQCYIDTDTDTDTDTLGDPQDEAGVGADVVLWQNDKEGSLIEEVVGEYRYDLENETHATYGVVRLNLWNQIKGKLKKGESND